jgi:hypothetical protein
MSGFKLSLLGTEHVVGFTTSSWRAQGTAARKNLKENEEKKEGHIETIRQVTKLLVCDRLSFLSERRTHSSGETAPEYLLAATRWQAARWRERVACSRDVWPR